jgi:hypothetical protein
MRLLKQSFLYFKEGNSDKVYEIDLCEVGNEKYVVNFRYGRRGAQLKEGSKTPVPVSLAEAEGIFDVVETEKISKGYTTSESGVSQIVNLPAFTVSSGSLPLNTDWAGLPKSRNKAILQRLHSAVNDTASSAKFKWKLSRIVWKAGEYRIKEAAPYILRLFNKGDQLHQYCCTWSLARCAGDTDSIAALQSIHHSHPVASLSKLAAAGLLQVLTGLEKERQLAHFTNRLPEALRAVVEAERPLDLDNLLQERISQQQPNYNWVEDIYCLSTEKRWMRTSVKKLVQQLPLRPNHFKHVRAVFKLAELLDDFEMIGLLACRFERESEMFSHSLSQAQLSTQELYIPEMEEWVKLSRELKKSNSRLAYSQKTRWNFHGRILRKLHQLGNNEDTNYVKLAISLLIGYRQKEDFKPLFSTTESKWNGRNYEQIETRFLQNAQAIFMHQVLSGNHPDITLQSGRLWRMLKPSEKQGASTQITKTAAPNDGLGGFIKKLTGLFGKKKESTSPETETNAKMNALPNPNGTPYLHLWNQVPQGYLQLLMAAEMDEIHEFAEGNLTIHPQYDEIKQRLDKVACKQLLSSAFAIPSKMGYQLATEKYSAGIQDSDLVIAMLNSRHSEARSKGIQWTESNQSNYSQQSGFITDLIFAKYPDIRSWGKSIIKNNQLTKEVKTTVVGKSIAEFLNYREQSTDNETIIKEAGDCLFECFGDEIRQVNLGVVSDLLVHPNALVLLIGLRMLKIKKQDIKLDELSNQFVFGLLQHTYAPVREEGIVFLSGMSAENLLIRQPEIIGSCLSSFENVRQGLRSIIQRMAEKDNAFGIHAAENLMPYLLRKEKSEGLHADLSQLLCNELSGYLQNANKETALNLLYSNYSAAQNVGVVILEKYTDPSQLSLPQVIALGAHENLNVREWCWKFYKEQTSRIKYEKEASLKLLDSKWQDTRQFAIQYFRENFSEGDWTPEDLITLADSVKPEIEAFGRELITRFFTTENGETYLMKLSQHPSEKMQLFATNYLERFATDDLKKLQSLEFYFRSILTRVHKSRIAKGRIFAFLLTEGRKSEGAAKTVGRILSDVSATAAIGDKARCIDILLQLKGLYELATPVELKELETRVA